MKGKLSGTGKSGRKAVYFIIFMLALIGLVSAGWYWAAQKLDRAALQYSEALQSQGKVLKCEGQRVVGYPFRLGIFCDDLIYGDPVSGTTIHTGAIRSAAQLYNPGHLVGEADSPFDLTLPGLAPLTLDWANLQASSKIGTNGLQRVSVVSDKLDILANDAGMRSLLASISHLETHIRPGKDEGSLELALSAKDWQINDGGSGTIEPVRVQLGGVIDGLLGALQNGIDVAGLVRVNGANGRISMFELETGTGGLVRMSGPISVDRGGRVSGELSIDVIDPEKLVNYAWKVFPPAGDALANVNEYLQAFANSNGGKVEIRDFKVILKDGEVFAGFFKIGEIPRLF
jgi:hypothetical protein